MELNQFFRINLILAQVFFFSITGVAADESVEDMLKRARGKFYAAVENKKQIEPAIKLFERIAQEKPKYAGRVEVYIGALVALRVEVYIGALVALKGKHAFLPHTKLKWAKRGLAIMDDGLKKSPTDIEALFIHGTTCYHLPFFFQRGDDAQRDFKEIVKRLPLQIQTYDPKLVTNIAVFLLEKAKLTHDEKTYLLTLRDRLESQHSVGHQ